MTQPNEVVTRADQLAFSGPVFREFTASLVNIEFPVENGRAKSKLQFTGMNVIDSIAPYPHPAGEIVMNRTGQNGARPSDRSPWGRLLLSSQEQGYPDILELLGKTLHILAHEQKIEANAERGTEAGSFLTWEILSVNGVDARATEATPTLETESDPKAEAPTNGAVSENDLLNLIHGKTVGEFTVDALKLPLSPVLRARMLDANGLLVDWVTQGKVTTDGNIYTKV